MADKTFIISGLFSIINFEKEKPSDNYYLTLNY